MPSRKRKSKFRPRQQPNDDRCFLHTLQQILGKDTRAWRLDDFVAKYAPSLQLDAAKISAAFISDLQSMVVAPMDGLKPVPHAKVVECREPLPSIVDDVVWELVQRRDRWKRMAKDGRNVFAQGFTTTTPNELQRPTLLPSTRPGLSQVQANDNVTFCRTSNLVESLHCYLGDDLLRMILLHTRLFVPIGSEPPAGNYCMVCGPPLTCGPALSRIQLAEYTERYDAQTKNQGGHRRKRRRRNHPETPESLTANKTISRFIMFYSDSFVPRVGFHHKHLFKRIDMTPEKLLKAMFQFKRATGHHHRKRWRRLRNSGVTVCDQILSLEMKCDYHRRLERYCALPSYFQGNPSYANENEEKVALQKFVQCHYPPEQVASFVCGIICEVFPPSFWGSQHNLNRVIQNVRVFASLRRKERLSNKRLMHGIRTVHFRWLQGERAKKRLSRSDHEATARLVLEALRWLFRKFIIPLIRSCFYATETEFSANKVLYYRKPVWSAIRYLSMRKMLQKQFRRLQSREVSICLRTHRMGFSLLRFLPKSTGVRPIAQLSQAGKVNLKDISRTSDLFDQDFGRQSAFVSRLSTNMLLSNTFDVLSYEASCRDRPFGSGLSGLSNFYPRYQRYIVNLKRLRGENESLNLVFASADIEKCYDNINQQHMLNIANRQFYHDDYVIQPYNLLFVDNVTGSTRKSSKKLVRPPEQHDLLHLGGNSVTSQIYSAVLDSRACDVVQRKHVLVLLKEHIQRHLVVTNSRFGHYYLLQTGGISQGSILSMLLCNLYYGSIEHLLLGSENPMNQQKQDESNDFLVRLVDDFLFVSPSREKVKYFLERMWKGCDDLGAKINKGKTRVSETMSLNIEGDDPLETRVLSLQGLHPKPFPWCGMLFDPRTGEVCIDYSRFKNGQAKDSLTVDCAGNEGKKLEMRMVTFLRPRCVPILFDRMLNSRKTITVNFHQMMSFTAAKTVEYLRSTDVNPDVARNEIFVTQCIESLAEYAARQIRCNLQHQSPDKQLFALDDSCMLWLTLDAFAQVFSRTELVSLSKRIQEMQQRCHRPSADLKAATERAFRLFRLDEIIDSDSRHF